MTSSHLLRFCFGSFAILTGASALVGCSAGEATRTGEAAPTFSPGYTPSTTTPPAGTSTTPAAPANGTGAAPNTQNTEGNTPVADLDPGQAETPNLSGTPVSATGSERLGMATMGGTGQSAERYQKSDVTRDGQNYFLMANGWGPGFQSQSISWSGTSFTIESMAGSPGPQFQPASYPTVFCGAYSDSKSGACGLPAELASMKALETGWSWSPNGNNGQYNAAYDIWLGTGPDRASFSGYLMVWYREPVGQQPAGRLLLQGVTVANVPGTWDVWTGAVGGKPIINWVRAEGQDTLEMEFDVLDFVRDAKMRGLEVPGTHVLSVAVGFEIWQGPITKLESHDFFVDVQ
jgi:glycosyl hydrolase family 12